MSIPQNPLAKFRTFSYFHILTICDNVKTASTLSQNTNVRQFLNSSTNKLTQTDVSTVKNSDGSFGKYVLLINGMKDARYSIDNLKWESLTGQVSDDNIDNYTSMATEGSVTITEPIGLLFLNEVQQAYRFLKSDPTACVWMIKTIFVGYSSDSGNPHYISNINPLIFNVIELTADFTVTGGVYNIGFVPINNGSGKLPQVMNITETMKLSLNDNPSLNDTINKLSLKIKENSKRYFDSVKDKVIKQGMNPKPVEYVFILDKHYTTNSGYTINDTQPHNKTNGSDEEGCHLDFSKSITIENALKMIMRHCPKVKEDATGINGEKYGYKIRSILNSDNKVHRITYYIQRYKLVFSDIFSATNSEDQEIKKAIKANTIEFDYTYSGNNTDIIDFSMKMDMGLVFFQTIISSNNLASQDATISGTTSNEISSQGKPADVKSKDENARNQKPVLPIFFSTKIKNPIINNSKDPKTATEFQTLLNRHAALENLNSKLKIIGNPNLLNSISKIPESYDTDISKNIPQFGDEAAALPYWESVPALAKINIYMPSADGKSREKFWYDGLYYIMSVTNEFNDGLFTQELEMISIPVNETQNDSTIPQNIVDKRGNPPEKITIVTNENKIRSDSRGIPPTDIKTSSVKAVLDNINTRSRNV